MKGYVFKDDKDYWWARYTYTDQNKRRRYVKRRAKVNTEDGAKAVLWEILQEHNLDPNIKAENIRQLCDYFELVYCIEPEFVNGRKVNGMKDYKKVKTYLDLYRKQFGKLRLDDLAYDHLRDFRLTAVFRCVRPQYMIVAMLPYPKELRARVVAAVEQGEFTIAEIANLFGVGPTFVKKMLRLHRAGDDLKPGQGGGPEALLQKKELALLRQEIKKRPEATLEELQKVLAARRQVTASLPSICRALQQLALPRKKKVSSPRSVMRGSAASSGR